MRRVSQAKMPEELAANLWLCWTGQTLTTAPTMTFGSRRKIYWVIGGDIPDLITVPDPRAAKAAVLLVSPTDRVAYYLVIV